MTNARTKEYLRAIKTVCEDLDLSERKFISTFFMGTWTRKEIEDAFQTPCTLFHALVQSEVLREGDVSFLREALHLGKYFRQRDVLDRYAKHNRVKYEMTRRPANWHIFEWMANLDEIYVKKIAELFKLRGTQNIHEAADLVLKLQFNFQKEEQNKMLIMEITKRLYYGP